MLVVVQIMQEVSPEWLIYQQEVGICNETFRIVVITLYYCTTPAPPTPTNVTAQFTSASSLRVTWQWTRSDPAPNCFNSTRVSYRPEGGGEFSLQLCDPTTTVATLTDLQRNKNSTITVVATAGEYRRESVTFLPLTSKVFLIATYLDVCMYLTKYCFVRTDTSSGSLR